MSPFAGPIYVLAVVQMSALLVHTDSAVKRSLESAKIPCHLEPTGLFRSDGKRSDGASIVPWKGGKVLVWDATFPDTLAPSYSTLAVREAGTVAADAEYKKSQKYSHLSSPHYFVPVAVETLGVFGKEARRFFREVAKRMKLGTDEQLAHQYQLQRISVAVQRGNAAAVLGCTGVRASSTLFVLFFVFPFLNFIVLFFFLL